MRGPPRAFVAVLAILLVLAGCTRSPETSPGNRSTTAAPSGPVIPGLAVGCPPVDTGVPYPVEGVLPEGAVGVRLCNGTEDFGRPSDQNDVQPPIDELTTSVDTLVRLVNDLPEVDDDLACTLEAGPDLVFWFRYAQGNTAAVHYGRYGCRTVVAAPGLELGNGDALHVAFAEALAAQRETMAPPSAVPEASCEPLPHPHGTALDLVRKLDLRTGALCRAVGGRFRPVAVLTARQVQRINDDWRVKGFQSGGRCRGNVTMLTGYTAWGDRVDLIGGCWRYAVEPLRRDPASNRILAWQASPEVARMLEELGP